MRPFWRKIRCPARMSAPVKSVRPSEASKLEPGRLLSLFLRPRLSRTSSRPFMLAPPGGGAELREVRNRISESPDEARDPGWQASCNVEHGAQVGRGSTKRPDAEAKSHSVKRTKARPARRFVAGERP